MVADAPYSQVLQFIILPSDITDNSTYSSGDMQFPGEVTPAFNTGKWLPTELYVKIVLRVSSDTATDYGNYDFYANLLGQYPAADSNVPNYLYPFVQESYYPGGDVVDSHGIINTYRYNLTPNGLPNGYVINWPGGDYTDYQTLEGIYTSDESSATGSASG